MNIISTDTLQVICFRVIIAIMMFHDYVDIILSRNDNISKLALLKPIIIKIMEHRKTHVQSDENQSTTRSLFTFH